MEFLFGEWADERERIRFYERAADIKKYMDGVKVYTHLGFSYSIKMEYYDDFQETPSEWVLSLPLEFGQIRMELGGWILTPTLSTLSNYQRYVVSADNIEKFPVYTSLYKIHERAKDFIFERVMKENNERVRLND
jgi:hypothetical protein